MTISRLLSDRWSFCGCPMTFSFLTERRQCFDFPPELFDTNFRLFELLRLGVELGRELGETDERRARTQSG